MKKTRLLIPLLAYTLACQSTDKSTKKDDKDAMRKHHHHHAGPGEAANEHMHQRPVAELIAEFESPARDAYQRPETVLSYLGDLHGQTIMDIGSGSGYFAFRLADKGASVIAADVDTTFQQYIEQKRIERKLSDFQFQTRLIPYDNPNLAQAEVNMALIVNTYHHIEDRPAYFAEVLAGLKPGGRLVVIDFQRKETPGVDMPMTMRMAPETVVAELKQSGFSKFEVNTDLLPYQYIITAR